MITASSLARLRACPSSAALQRAETHNEWADLGHDAHEVLADLANLEPKLAQYVPPGARVEVKFAYDVTTGTARIIREGGGRNYGVIGPTEIAGSCDVLGVEFDRVVIVDWKTGFANVEPARTNAQLWFYALAACRALGLHVAIVRVVYTQSGRCDEYEIDALELAGFAQDLTRLARQVDERRAAGARGELLDTREGAWCKHCASKHVCPSKNGLLVQIAEQGAAMVGDAAMTQDRARTLYAFLDRVKTLVKEADKRLAVYVTEQGPIDLGEGRMFGRYVTMGNERVNGPIAVQAIHDVCGDGATAFAESAITASTSKAAITRAAKSVGDPSLAKRVLARARELGGIMNEQKMPIGEYQASEHAAARLVEFPVDDVNHALAQVTP